MKQNNNCKDRRYIPLVFMLFIFAVMAMITPIQKAYAACAATSTSSNTSLPYQEIDLLGPSNSSTYFNYELSNWSSWTTVTIIKNEDDSGCTEFDEDHDGWRLYGQSNQPIIDRVYMDGLLLNAFEASVTNSTGQNIDGIWYIIQSKTDLNYFYLNDYNNFENIPIWTREPEDGVYSGSYQIRYRIKLLMSPGSAFPVGEYTVSPPAGGIGEIFLTNNQTATSKVISKPMNFDPIKFKVTGSTCSVNMGDVNQTVELPMVNVNAFKTVGTTAGKTPFSIRVDCPAGISLYATMTDANSPGNFSDVLTLMPNSDASGLGLRIYSIDTQNIISYGPESASPNNTNQFYIGGGEDAATTNYNIPFYVEYIQLDETVGVGALSAQAIITFSYQ